MGEVLKKSIQNSIHQPFILFFPLGLSMGLVFLGCWPFYVFSHTIPYPGMIHAFGIISLFIGSFAIGFLLTAIPRFTATQAASGFEVFSLFIVSIVELTSLLLAQTSSYFAFVTLIKFIMLFIFVFKRKVKSDVPTPASFSWVILGIISGIFGILGYSLEGFFPVLVSMQLLYRALFLRGFLTGLLMGIGGRLVPFLTGIGDGVTKSEAAHKTHFVCSIIYFFALILEHLLPAFQNYFLLAQGITLFFEVACVWKLYQLPAKGSRSIGLWMASWNLVFGNILAGLFYNYKIHFLHLAFVGGFAMATIAVASHVKVAHLNFNKKKLVYFWPLGFILTFIFLAALTRVAAPFSSYLNHLAYSALTVCLALIIWAFTFKKA